MRKTTAILAVLGLFGCAEPVPPTTDPAVLASPLAPDFGACLGGSVVAHEHGPSTCEPWPLGARPACAVDEMPTGSGCRRVGRACDGERAPAEGVVLHVDAAAAPGGDGSEGAPFVRIADALAFRPSDVTIRLAAGEHEGRIALGAGVTLEGVCAARTIVVPPAGEEGTDAVVQVDGPRVVLRDLRIQGAVGYAIRADAPAELTLEGIVVEAAQLCGIGCAGCALDARDVLVRDTVGLVRGSPATGGYGLLLQGARATLSRVTVERANEIGLLIAAETEANLIDVAVLEVTPGPAGLMGVGLAITGRSTADIQSLVVEGTARTGVAIEDGAHAVLRDVLVRDVRGLIDQERPLGWALGVLGESEVELTRFVAVQALGGIEVTGGSAQLEDVRLDDMHGAAPLGTWGVALRAVGGARMTATRVHLEDLSDLAIVAHEASDVQLTDVRVLRVEGAFDPEGGLEQVTGLGLLVRGGAHVALVRAEIAETTFAAVAAAENAETTLTLEDVWVRDVGPGPVGRLGGGRALMAVQGASIVGRRVRVERAVELAVSAWMGGRLELQDLEVLDTLARADGTAGVAAGAYGGGHLALDRFLLSGAPLCGLQLAYGASLPDPSAPASESGGTATLHEGRIERAPIGVNVQVVDTDLELLVAELTFSEVERRLAADALLVPRPDVSQVLDP